MKSLFLSLLLSCAILSQAFAQDDTTPAARHNKAIFIELLGSGMGVTANYDMRFSKGRQDGFGIRAGVGGMLLESNVTDEASIHSNFTTFPIVVNYLIGKKRSALEAGIGIVPMYGNLVKDSSTQPKMEEKGWGSTGTLNLGYRYQPLNSGFVFRLTWSPAVNSTGFSPAWFGMSLGYGFK